jgi:myosin I
LKIFFKKVSTELEKLCKRNLLRKYCLSFSLSKKSELQDKVLASELFKGKKETYPESVKVPFKSDIKLADNDYFKTLNDEHKKYFIDKKFMNDSTKEKEIVIHLNIVFVFNIQ